MLGLVASATLLFSGAAPANALTTVQYFSASLHNNTWIASGVGAIRGGMTALSLNPTEYPLYTTWYRTYNQNGTIFTTVSSGSSIVSTTHVLVAGGWSKCQWTSPYVSNGYQLLSCYKYLQ